jgi:hypothetical protein
MEMNEYLAGMVGLFFIYAIIWYIISMGWVDSGFLDPIGKILGLCALVYTAIFVVNKIREE